MTLLAVAACHYLQELQELKELRGLQELQELRASAYTILLVWCTKSQL